MSKTIIFFGNERLATGVNTHAPTLGSLIDSAYHVAAVVSNYEKGLSRNARELEIATKAGKHNIPVLLPNHPRDIAEQLAKYNAEIGVLVAYGKIVPQSIIDIFPKGIVNIHPSLLPKYRGPTPIEQVILDGVNITGVSIMQLAKEMDAGPVFAQSELTLTGTETKQELADKLLDMGGSMLLEVLPGILDETIVALPQNDSQATYDNLISKNDGIIDWSKPAVQIEREVRAFVGWPQSTTTLANKSVVITEAKVSAGQGVPGMVLKKKEQLIIACGKEAIEITKIKPAGKREMLASEFLAGHSHIL